MSARCVSEKLQKRAELIIEIMLFQREFPLDFRLENQRIECVSQTHVSIHKTLQEVTAWLGMAMI